MSTDHEVLIKAKNGDGSWTTRVGLVNRVKNQSQ